MTFLQCPAKTMLTDAELAGIIRSIAPEGTTPTLYAVGTYADCQMQRFHSGDCGGWVATIDGDKPESTCWLHWDGEARRVLAWLPDCLALGVNGCVLHAGHPGDCAPMGNDASDGQPES